MNEVSNITLRDRSRVLISVALLLAMASPAVAGLSASLKCQDSIALSARNYFKARYKHVSKCERKKAAGKLALSVDCRADSVSDPRFAAKLERAADRFLTRPAGKCTPQMIQGLTFGLPCGPLNDFVELQSCIVNEAHGENADRLIETVFGNSGLLEDPSLRECQKTIVTRSQNYSKDRMTAYRTCAKKLMSGKIDGPCPDAKTRKKLDKALTKFREKVLEKCSAAAVVDQAISFGFPCENFQQVTFVRQGTSAENALPASERLVRCIAAAAAADADLGADTAYPLPEDPPFPFGVAAGDATDSAVIVWTRTDGPGAVTLQLATDPDFEAIIFNDPTLTPDAAADNTIKTEVTGLNPAALYYYRFIQNGVASRTGRIRTAPSPTSTSPVRFVWTGDSNAFYKPYTVLDRATADDPDLWLYIGDTIYGDDNRTETPPATTRSQYHDKYEENRSDRSLRDLMARVGTVTTWDDHEVVNDFYGTNPAIQTQMATGNQAFRDYMPIRDNPDDPLQLYRSFQWGRAAEFFLIDVRQYRDAPANVLEPTCNEPDGGLVVVPTDPACLAAIADPSRTYLGAEQKQWLKDGLLSTTATFKFIMNGPLISNLIFQPYDRWEGYSAERAEILKFIDDNNIKNVIFLSTDIHAAIINDAVATTPTVRELVSGAIGMDTIFRELPPSVAEVVPTLPTIFATISYFDIDRFNYALIEASPSEAKVTYRDVTGGVLRTVTIPAE